MNTQDFAKQYIADLDEADILDVDYRWRGRVYDALIASPKTEDLDVDDVLEAIEVIAASRISARIEAGDILGRGAACRAGYSVDIGMFGTGGAGDYLVCAPEDEAAVREAYDAFPGTGGGTQEEIERIFASGGVHVIQLPEIKKGQRNE